MRDCLRLQQPREILRRIPWLAALAIDIARSCARPTTILGASAGSAGAIRGPITFVFEQQWINISAS
jgi:hypothetical protein